MRGNPMLTRDEVQVGSTAVHLVESTAGILQGNSEFVWQSSVESAP